MAIRGIDRISVCESMARACSTVGAAINPSQLQPDPLPNGSGDGQGLARDIHFPGTALKWIGRRDAWSGIANVYIDGVLKAASRRLRSLVTIEPYWRPFRTQTPVRRR